ncbi:dynein axonemal heavy chain 3-like [Rhincodon typus]|uniref:dynein axonemal heavy chain 3-like n=1 Tax=Rhincodon typus TaxID=259920 RepID=UPI00202EC953|nr:dynein axonemal heavy chain 3-like [Rhincodon typus]
MGIGGKLCSVRSHYWQNGRQLSLLEIFLNEYNQVPFEALIYLTGECNYGGRVTDDHDRRLLLSLLENFYCQSVISDDCYKFSASGIYLIPRRNSYESYLEYIKQLPLNADPEVFGLHENANITKEQKETQRLFDGILSTLPREVSGGDRSSSEIVQELATDILSKIPSDFVMEDVMNRYPTKYSESMNTVLVQELLHFNRLISIIRTSLRDINKAIQGLILMSSQLEDIFNSMIVGKCLDAALFVYGGLVSIEVKDLVRVCGLPVYLGPGFAISQSLYHYI